MSADHTSMSMSAGNSSMSLSSAPCDHECFWGCEDDEGFDSDEEFDCVGTGEEGDVMSKYLNMLSGFSELFTEDHTVGEPWADSEHAR